MSEAKNMPAFKVLIAKYESITIGDIDKAAETLKRRHGHEFWYKFKQYHPSAIATLITGFGEPDLCALCVEAEKHCKYIKDSRCKYCVYAGEFNLGCMAKPMDKSYNRICEAMSRLDLLAAFKERAKAMRKFAKSKGIEI